MKKTDNKISTLHQTIISVIVIIMMLLVGAVYLAGPFVPHAYGHLNDSADAPISYICTNDDSETQTR